MGDIEKVVARFNNSQILKVHVRDFEAGTETVMKDSSFLQANQEVEFEVTIGPKCPQAINVKGRKILTNKRT